MTTQASAAYALDAGGSHTVVRTRRADGNERTWDEPSCAIATVGQRRAIKQLRRILGEVRAELADAGTMRGCIASSSCPVAGEAPPPELLVRAIAASGCTGGVVLVNDVVPLRWSDLLAGCGVIVNSGTGSAVLGRWLAELPRARFEVARFAAEILAADEEGDTVASTVVAAESEALSQAALLAVSRLGLGNSPAVGLSGGVMVGSPRFRTLVVDGLARGGLR